jgi:hypothetical protein
MIPRIKTHPTCTMSAGQSPLIEGGWGGHQLSITNRGASLPALKAPLAGAMAKSTGLEADNSHLIISLFKKTAVSPSAPISCHNNGSRNPLMHYSSDVRASNELFISGLNQMVQLHGCSIRPCVQPLANT